MCSCRNTTWTWDWVWLYDWFVFFFLKSPFPLSKTRKTALETHHVIPCSLFLTQNHPVESTEASLYDPVLGCEYPSLRSSYKAEEKDGSFMEMEICRLWISDDIRWYGYRWMESVVKGESLLWIFPHIASPWQVWFEVGTFWTSAGFRFCGYAGEGTSQGAGCGFARWHPVVLWFQFPVHYIFSFHIFSYPQSEYCTSIVWTDQGPEFEREYLDVRDRAAASFQEWQEIVDEWKKGLLTRRILFCSQDGMCVFSINFPVLIVLFVDLRRLEDLGNELVELRKKDRQMRQMMDEKVALGFVGWERVVGWVGCTEKQK